MTALKLRIDGLTEKLAAVGLAGGNMNDTLRKLAEKEDLSGNEVRRIAEEANRKVQLGLYKVAADKRFKFELADGQAIAGERTKSAEEHPEISKEAELDVKLSAVEDAGGDPFAIERSDLSKLSLFQADVDAKVAENLVQIQDAEIVHELRKAASALEAVRYEAQVEESAIKRAAIEANDHLVQSAVDLVTHGITLPSLYDAVLAGVSGSNSGISLEDGISKTDALMHLVVAGLKKRGIENHKMGFRHNGDPQGLSQLTADQLIALCKRHSSYQRPQDLTMVDVKTAELLKTADTYIEHYSSPKRGGKGDSAPLRPEDALDILKDRGSQNGQFAVPQAYLDDADNLPGGQPRVYNTNDEFIVAVNDLVGAQDRMRRCHAAQEYIGLKLKKIEDAVAAMSEARKTADLAIKEGARVKVSEAISIEESKEAFWGALARGAAGLAKGLVKATPKPIRSAVKGVAAFGNHPGTMAATMAAPLLFPGSGSQG